jgi:hypothetical protein
MWSRLGIVIPKLSGTDIACQTAELPHRNRIIAVKLGKISVLSCMVGLLVFILTSLAVTQAITPTLPPAELVRQAVQNEVSANALPSQHFMFRDDRRTQHTSQTKLVIETRDATAGMIILQDGQPLNRQQQQAELARLENYVRNPEELNKKRRQEKEDGDRTVRILKALPDAFLYDPDGVQEGGVGVGRPGVRLVRLKFRPNPAYDPPSRVEQVLTGMVGTLLVDATEKRIAEINGTLQKDVGFGWGILGHLDNGGRFVVQQADVGKKQWELTRMELAFTGKVFLFKKLNIRSSDIFSGFRPVPKDLSFAQAVDLLKKEAARVAPNANRDNSPGEKARADGG